MPIKSVIRSVAHHVPARIVTNDDLALLMTTSDEWIRERTGIEERRFIEDPSTTTTDIGQIAAESALTKAGVDINDIDLIVGSTLSPDLYFPGIGTLLQQRLGGPMVGALDIRAQCSGLVYGLSVCDAYIRSGMAKKILLVCAEVQSPVLDMSDNGRDIAVLFGDGAGALVIEAEECSERPTLTNNERGIIDSVIHSDGSGAELLALKSPGTATEGFFSKEAFESGAWHPKMDGRAVFKNAVTRMSETAGELLTRAGGNAGVDSIDLLIPHQANLRINDMVREKVGLPAEKAFNNIQKYGNTTSATIPIAMAEAQAEGKLAENTVLMTLAFGAGFTWGGNLIRW